MSMLLALYLFSSPLADKNDIGGIKEVMYIPPIPKAFMISFSFSYLVDNGQRLLFSWPYPYNCLIVIVHLLRGEMS